MSPKQRAYLRKIKRNNLLILIIQILIISSFLIIWELLSKYNIINSFIFSSPSKIIKTLISLIRNHNFFNHLYTTTKEVLISFGLGFIISLLVATIFYLVKPIYRVLDPFITMLNSLPKVAIGPLILIWCGANIKSVIIMALLINLIVSLVTIYTGMLSVNKNHILLFESFNASKWQTLYYLIIPSSLSSIISAIKLGLSLSFIGVIMGEFLVSKEGIGYLIIYGTQVFNLDLVLTGVSILIILSYIFYKPIAILENKMQNRT